MTRRSVGVELSLLSNPVSGVNVTGPFYLFR